MNISLIAIATIIQKRAGEENWYKLDLATHSFLPIIIQFKKMY